MKKNVSLCIMLICIACAVAITCFNGSEQPTVAAVGKEKNTVIVIDAGHGGLDGGASGYDGVPEKKYNLMLAETLRALFDAAGYQTEMTRTDDGDTDGMDGFDKKRDIANRLLLAEKTDNRIYISLHLNLSTSPNDKGFQVFYGSKNENSRTLAEAIHKKLDASGLCTRVREVKKAPNGVFLQHHIKTPCVLAECGFISNSEDYNLLKSEEYRSKLMFTVFCAVKEYLQ